MNTSGSAILWYSTVSGIRRLNAGDTVRISTSQNTGSNQTLVADPAINRFSIERIGGIA
jgi:hypothetical protein